jgi:uroporphyrinogen-III decarboxylase
MTQREILMASLSGAPTDRVPVWLLFPYHRIGCYVDVRQHPKYLRVFEESKKRAFMLNRRSIGTSLFVPEVEHERQESTVDGDRVVRSLVSYRGRSIESETRHGASGTSVRKLLSSDADLEFYCSLPIQTDDDAIRAELDTKIAAYEQDRSEFPEEYGAMMLALGEPIGPIYGAASTEEYAIWSLTHADLIADFLDRNMRRLVATYRYFLERDLADVYFLVGSELASPPLVSRDTFRSWIVPYAKELIALIHSYGKKAIQHYHGQIAEILPDFVEMAPDALHTIEAPPVGNCTFTQAFEVTADTMTLIGNIQYDCFRSYEPREMADAVRAVCDECRGKRFILSPTAGPYDPDVDDRVIDNYLAFMKAAWEYSDERSTTLV